VLISFTFENDVAMTQWSVVKVVACLRLWLVEFWMFWMFCGVGG